MGAKTVAKKKASARRAKSSAKASATDRKVAAAPRSAKKTPAKASKAPARKTATKKAARKPSGKKTAAKKAVAKKPHAKKAATKKPAFCSTEVSLVQVFSLRPRVNTSFRPEDFRTAKHRLREESYPSREAAARAVVERAHELRDERPNFARKKH